MDFIVRVDCITFNQSSFIIDTMNGFCMQETSFPFVCTIIDDCSSDGEKDVIQDYLEHNFELANKSVALFDETDDYLRIFAQHKNNINCFFDVYYLKYNHYSIRKDKRQYVKSFNNTKYTAFCEGDDYWIDTRKLQKEVDFLEEHDDYSMVHTAYNRLYQNTGSFVPVVITDNSIIDSESLKWAILINDVQIGTATVIIRSNLLAIIHNEFADDFNNAIMGDVQRWFHCARLSKVHYITDITAVYRKNEGTLTSINSAKRYYFLKNAFEVHLKLATKYGAPNEIVKQIRERYGSSVICTGIDYRMYEDCVAFVKVYMPQNKWLLLLLSFGRSMPFIKPSIFKRVALYFL